KRQDSSVISISSALKTAILSIFGAKLLEVRNAGAECSAIRTSLLPRDSNTHLLWHEPTAGLWVSTNSTGSLSRGTHSTPLSPEGATILRLILLELFKRLPTHQTNHYPTI